MMVENIEGKVLHRTSQSTAEAMKEQGVAGSS